MATLAMIAGTSLMAAGQIQQGRAAEKEGSAAYKMGLYNKEVQEREARAIEQKASFDSLRQAKRARQEYGKAIVSAAGRGAMPGEGAAAAIPDETLAELELENMLIGYESRTQAARARRKGELDLYEGILAKKRGKQAKKAAYISAGASILTGFAMSGIGGDTGQLTKTGKATTLRY